MNALYIDDFPYYKVYKPREQYIFMVNCSNCNKTIKLIVPKDGLLMYRFTDTLIQDCFPEMTAAERGLMLSGTCEDCWNELFPQEENDEEHN